MSLALYFGNVRHALPTKNLRKINPLRMVALALAELILLQKSVMMFLIPVCRVDRRTKMVIFSTLVRHANSGIMFKTCNVKTFFGQT